MSGERRADVVDLEVVDVTKRFAGTRAVDGVSFEVPAGSFFSILGPSGCGKTTLMRMIAGFSEPESGDIRIRGRSMLGVPPNRRPVNMVFQNLALFPMMSVGENVAYGLRCRGIAAAEALKRSDKILARVGLPGFAGRRVDELSGGQRQRVAIARCLVLEPTLVLLDEPLGALDLKLREHMKIELKQLQTAFHTTFVYITHDQSEALVMSDRVAVMNQGRFEQVGTPRELYHHPVSAFVAGFVGASNRFAARILGRDGARLRLALDSGIELVGTAHDGAAPGAAAEVFVRPESIAFADHEAALAALENRFAARVTGVFFDGANSTVLVAEARSGAEIRAALPQTGPMAALAVGQEVRLGFSAAAAACFARA